MAAKAENLGVLFGKLNDAVNNEEFDAVVTISDLGTRSL